MGVLHVATKRKAATWKRMGKTKQAKRLRSHWCVCVLCVCVQNNSLRSSYELRSDLKSCCSCSWNTSRSPCFWEMPARSSNARSFSIVTSFSLASTTGKMEKPLWSFWLQNETWFKKWCCFITLSEKPRCHLWEVWLFSMKSFRHVRTRRQ